MTTKRLGIVANLDNLRKIEYVSRDFVAIRNDLNAFLIQSFPEAIGSDFTEASGTQQFVELIAYVGDTLNFLLDKQFNELFLSRSVETDNAYALAKGLGYQPNPVKPSIAEIDFTFDVPVTGSLTAQYFFVIGRGAKFNTDTQTGITFENLEPIIFNNESVSTYDSVVTTGSLGTTVTRFTKHNIKVISGQTQKHFVTIGDATAFKRIHIPNGGSPINDVLEVTDSENNTWYRVKNLSQEFIFTGIPNFDTDTATVPYQITVKRVPRRYVVEFNADGSVDIVFGSGEVDLTDSEFVLSPENIVFPNKTIGKFFDFSPDAIQLQDFLNTTTLGVAPSNINMNVRYRTGGGISDNIGAGRISKIQGVDVQFYSLLLNAIERDYVIKSMTVSNPEPSQGGEEAETLDQIRVNASYWYAAQDRVVSIEDYIARVATLPSQYGSVYKVVAVHAQNQTYSLINQLTDKVSQLVTQRSVGLDDTVLLNQIQNLNASIQNSATDIILMIICRDSDGHLAKSTSTLRKNILTYLNFFKVASDTLSVQDVNVLNLGCRFMIHVDTSAYKPSEVQLNVMSLLQSYFDLGRMEIGKNINIDDVRATILTQVKGVISIPELSFFTIIGTVDGRAYSTDFNSSIDQFLSYNGTIIECPNDTIIEFKYPSQDILGRFAD